MGLTPFIQRFRERFAEVEAQLSAPDAFANVQRGGAYPGARPPAGNWWKSGDAYLRTVSRLAPTVRCATLEPRVRRWPSWRRRSSRLEPS